MRVVVKTTTELWAGGLFVEVFGYVVEHEHSFLECSFREARQFEIDTPESEIAEFIQESKEKVLQGLRKRKEQYDKAKALERKYSIAEEYLI